MAVRNCNKCGNKHGYPWGKSCRFSLSNYRESNYQDKGESSDSDHMSLSGATGHLERKMSQWVTEAVNQSKAASYDMVQGVEHGLQASIQE